MYSESYSNAVDSWELRYSESTESSSSDLTESEDENLTTINPYLRLNMIYDLQQYAESVEKFLLKERIDIKDLPNIFKYRKNIKKVIEYTTTYNDIVSKYT